MSVSIDPAGMPPDINKELKKAIRTQFLITFATVLVLVAGLGFWVGTQKIAGAVVSGGKIVVESNIKQVQHREGGIVRQIHVKNGDQVKAGAVLVRLDDTVTRANLALITKQLDEFRAQEGRLVAERDNKDTVAFETKETSPGLMQIQQGQVLLFEARKLSLAGRQQQLREQIKQFETQIEGLGVQLAAKKKESGLAAEELKDLVQLSDRHLVAKSRVTGLQREKARIDGEHGALVAQMAQAREAISEREIQILQLSEDRRSEVLEQLQQVRAQIAQLEEQGIAARDQLRRVDIVAPQAGYVHQLATHTVNGVIGAGETLMLIVPEEDELIVETQVRPVDIDQLEPGQIARIRFPSFDQRVTPELSGHLETVSADLTEDPRTGLAYYTARLIIDDKEMEKLNGKELLPGMPAEVFLTTQERTILSYLLKPITEQIAHALNER